MASRAISQRRTAAQRFLAALTKRPDRPWTGPVERRPAHTYQRRSEVLTWMCRNPFCRQWTMNGSYKTGRCNFCQTPR